MDVMIDNKTFIYTKLYNMMYYLILDLVWSIINMYNLHVVFSKEYPYIQWWKKTKVNYNINWFLYFQWICNVIINNDRYFHN